jgi:hypothetical protein
MTDYPIATYDELNDSTSEEWDYDVSDDYDDSFDEDEWDRYEIDHKLEEDDRFFERWGYYPDDETPEEAALRAELEEQEHLLSEINSQGKQGGTTKLGVLIYEAFTTKR